jgi:hypothetical protein
MKSIWKNKEIISKDVEKTILLGEENNYHESSPRPKLAKVCNNV